MRKRLALERRRRRSRRRKRWSGVEERGKVGVLEIYIKTWLRAGIVCVSAVLQLPCQKGCLLARRRELREVNKRRERKVDASPAHNKKRQEQKRRVGMWRFMCLSSKSGQQVFSNLQNRLTVCAQKGLVLVSSVAATHSHSSA